MAEEAFDIVQYARNYGLCLDYRTVPSLSAMFVLPDEAVDHDLEEIDAREISDKIKQLTSERLSISKEAGLLLKAVCLDPAAPAPKVQITSKRDHMLQMKQELPILRTDHEEDFLHFTKRRDFPEFADLNIPSEIINIEEDEGLEWPTRYYKYPDMFDEQIRAEKLAVSKDTLFYLQETLRAPEVPKNDELFELDRPRKRTMIQPLTPPLLPLSPPITPYIPSSPGCHLPLLSDSFDSLAAESNALQEKLFAEDNILFDSADIDASLLAEFTNPPGFSPLFEDQSLLLQHAKAENLKVEGPLTPPMFSDSPMKTFKSVSFADILQEYIPDEAWPISSGSENTTESSNFEDIFREIAPIAEQVNERLRNEKLSGADTMARVPIPDIDFSWPVAPWDQYTTTKRKPGVTDLDAQMQFLHRVKREDLRTATSWQGVSAMERNLQWSIFMTRGAEVKLDEKLHGEAEASKMLAELTLGNIANSSTYTWKREGLMLLIGDHDEDEDDELEPAEFEIEGELNGLVRKRQIELDEFMLESRKKRAGTPEAPCLAQRPSSLLLQQGQIQTDHSARQVQLQTLRVDTPNHIHDAQSLDEGLLFGGFSASTALQMFMQTRGKSGKQSVNLVQIKSNTPGQMSYHSRHSSEKATVIEQSGRPEAVEELPPISLPELPSIPADIPKASFIASAALLQRRSLMQRIDKLHLQAETIYRDYTLPHSPSQEADLVLSPSTGMIFTTMTQVKQRALPGQTDRSPIKERIKLLSLRYERLIVMISEGLSKEMERQGACRPEDARDTEALAQLENFTTQIEGEVLLQYVPGGEQSLSHAIVLEMVKFQLPHGSADLQDIKLLAAETTWETFLRRAGLNPYAAQVILASLKHPAIVSDNSIGTDVSVSGLSAFLIMSVEERVRRFQVNMGGSRILKTVSNSLDQKWMSAAHGFRL